jgi:hypothetical protein
MTDDLTTAKKHLRAARKLLQDNGGSEAQQLLTRLEAKPQSNTMLYALAGVMLLAGLVAGFAGGFLTRPNAEPELITMVETVVHTQIAPTTEPEVFVFNPELCDIGDWMEATANNRERFFDATGDVDKMLIAFQAYADAIESQAIDCAIVDYVIEKTVTGMGDMITAYNTGEGSYDIDYIVGYGTYQQGLGAIGGYLQAQIDASEQYRDFLAANE